MDRRLEKCRLALALGGVLVSLGCGDLAETGERAPRGANPRGDALDAAPVNPNCLVNPIGSAWDPVIGMPSPTALRELAPNGVLTVAVSTNNANVGSFNTATRVISGTAVDIVCRMAAQLNLPLQFTNEPTQVSLAADFPKGLWNIGFAANPDNSTVALLDPPPLFANLYISVEVTYLVSVGSPFKHVADIDQPGVKVAVNTGSAADNYLTKLFAKSPDTHPTLVRIAAINDVLVAVQNGSVDAAASGRPVLTNFINNKWPVNSDGTSGGRTLLDNLFLDPVGPFMHQGNEEAVCYLSDYIEAAKTSGLIQQAINRTAALGSIAGRSAWPAMPTCPPRTRCRSVTVPADDSCHATASINAGSDDPDSDLSGCTQDPPGPYPLGTTEVTLTCRDAEDRSSSCSAAVTVVDVTPPAIVCPANQVLECKDEAAVASFEPTVADNCGVATLQCSPPSGTSFAEDRSPAAVNCVAVDAAGNEASCAFQVTVQDTLPPVVTTNPGDANGFIASLWPPNQSYHTIRLADCIEASVDQCDGTAVSSRIIGVASDEPAGNNSSDILIADDGASVRLRAGRDGSGDGRVYTIFAVSSDDDGNVSHVSCKVQVPHDQSGAAAVDSGTAYCVGTCN